MKKIILAFLLITNYIQAQTSLDKMDSLLVYFNDHKKFLGQTSFKLGNSTVYAKTFGYTKDPKENTYTNNSRYRIGSISNTFTATMIMQLVEEKKLKLTDKLSNFYPKVDNAKRITIQNLLNHRSGIPDYVYGENPINIHNKKLTKQDALKKIYSYKNQFEPNSRLNFSTSNYLLLSLIIEDVTKESYNTNLQKRICKPLKLYNTYLGGKEINGKNNEVYSYKYKNKNWELYPETNLTVLQGAGGIISTAQDLTSLMNGLFTNIIISKESLDLMTTIKDGFGFGLAHVPFNGRNVLGHGGKLDGFETFVGYYPQEKFSHAFLYNGNNTDLNQLNTDALSVYYRLPYKFPEFIEIEIPEETLKGYTGLYKSEDMPMIKISLVDGDLYAQLSGQNAFPLTPKTNNQFTFDPAQVKITFENGKLTINQSTAIFIYQKI